MSRPTNPDSYWNRLDGAPAVDNRPHVIEDIRMRRATDEYWVLCRCGERVGGYSYENLAAMYEWHKNKPALMGGAA